MLSILADVRLCLCLLSIEHQSRPILKLAYLKTLSKIENFKWNNAVLLQNTIDLKMVTHSGPKLAGSRRVLHVTCWTLHGVQWFQITVVFDVVSRTWLTMVRIKLTLLLLCSSFNSLFQFLESRFIQQNILKILKRKFRIYFPRRNSWQM